MSKFRKSALFVVIGLLAALIIGFAVSSAEAGCHKYGFGYGHASYGIHVAHYQPLVKYIQKPHVYPVLLYDCYGQPYYEWKTSYTTVPVTYWP